MKLTDFLLDVSTDPAAMAKFRCDPEGALDRAGLSDAEKKAVMEGNPKKLKTMVQMSARQPGTDISASTPPSPNPTPPPELEIDPHEPVEIEANDPPPEVDQQQEIDPGPDLDVDESTTSSPMSWTTAQFDSMWQSAGLTIVGLGIRGGLQTTPEARLCITQATKVLFLVADPISEIWIQSLNATSESLSGFYENGKRRLDIYNAIVEKIMEELRERGEVCVVLYGHPGVLAYPARVSMKRARQEGFSARMFPGVSAEDNLFADLGVDFGTSGIQSYEVTRFLLHKYRFDPSAALVLWQIGVLGETRWNPPHDAARGRLKVLAEYLSGFYGPEHVVILYHAPEIATGRPGVQRVTLAELPHAKLFSISTLYIPPKGTPLRDPQVAEKLMIER
jgi:hypothetical protein